jgi:membrane associated rhomboid family serine protease
LALWLLVSASALCCGLIVWRFRRRRGAAIAVAGTLLSVALRCAEVLSYHGLDAMLYASMGKVMVVSILWIGLTLLTCLGVWIDETDHRGRDSIATL